MSMIPSILKKLAFALLWIWIISLLAFWLSKKIPGDEFLDYLSIERNSFTTSLNPGQERDIIQQVAAKRGLDLPYFYFSIHKGIYPDTLYRIFPAGDQETVKSWITRSNNHRASVRLFEILRNTLHSSCLPAYINQYGDSLCLQINSILRQQDVISAKREVDKLASMVNADTARENFKIVELNQLINELNDQRSIGPKNIFPSISWNGFQNQYHRWLTGFLTMRSEASLIDGRNAWVKITEALKWTLLLNGIAVLLAFIMGCVIGIWSALRDQTRAERITSILLFALFAIPSFWLATLLIFAFSSGEWIRILPSGGLGPYDSADTVIEKWAIVARHLFLPVLCLGVGALAFVAKQMKQSMLFQLQQPYVNALRQNGISEKSIVRKHVIRNAFFPMITLLGKSLPEIISGSLIIEVIFSIPGMGRLMYTSLLARDWPVVFPTLMLIACVTVLCYVITDILYKAIDPRVRTAE